MKNKILIPCLIIGALAAVVSFRYSGQGSHSSEDKRKLVLQSVMETIKSGHFSPKALDDTFSSRVYKMIVREFDYEKLFFTRQDMKMISSYEFKLDDEIAANSIEFFDSLDAVFLRRLKGVQQLDSEILKKPFTFDGNEVFQENYDKQEYARDDNELPAKWHDFIKLQVLVR